MISTEYVSSHLTRVEYKTDDHLSRLRSIIARAVSLLSSAALLLYPFYPRGIPDIFPFHETHYYRVTVNASYGLCNRYIPSISCTITIHNYPNSRSLRIPVINSLRTRPKRRRVEPECSFLSSTVFRIACSALFDSAEYRRT